MQQLILDTLDSQLTSLELLIRNPIPVSGKCLRARSSPTKIKALYHLYQLNRNVKSGKWTSIHQGKTRMSKGAKISRRHFYEFIKNNLSLFGKSIRRTGTTSEYHLDEWVVKFFEFFEKNGMMKGFREDFSSWREMFLTRLDKWLTPLIQKGLSLEQILMNKLSTGKALKGSGSKGLKGSGIKPSSKSLMKPKGIKTNIEDAELDSKDSIEVNSILRCRLSLSEADVKKFRDYNGLKVLKKSALELCSYIENREWKPRSMVRALQATINKYKMESILNNKHKKVS